MNTTESVVYYRLYRERERVRERERERERERGIIIWKFYLGIVFLGAKFIAHIVCITQHVSHNKNVYTWIYKHLLR